MGIVPYTRTDSPLKNLLGNLSFDSSKSSWAIGFVFTSKTPPVFHLSRHSFLVTLDVFKAKFDEANKKKWPLKWLGFGEITYKKWLEKGWR